MYKIVNRKKLLATAILDGMLRLACLPWTRRRQNEPISPEAVRSILLIRTAYIGDVVMTLPMLRPLKERFPKSTLVLLAAPGAASLLAGNPFVDEVLAFAPFWFHPAGWKGWLAYLKFIRLLRQRRFDLVIEARGDVREILLLALPARSRFRVSYGVGGGARLLTHVVPYERLAHKVEYHLDICRFLGCPDGPIEWGVRLSAEERQRARTVLSDLNVRKPCICIHPGSRLSLKIWPAEHFAVLCDRLLEKFGQPLLLFGTAGDLALIEEIQSRMKGQFVSLAGRTSLREMAALLEQASLFICNDSAPMHVAAAMQVPTVAVFGPSKSLETRPFSPCAKVVENDFPCRFSCDEHVCVRSVKQECMRSVAPDAVLQAAERMLAVQQHQGPLA